jgi:hypothetical protein
MPVVRAPVTVAVSLAAPWRTAAIPVKVPEPVADSLADPRRGMAVVRAPVTVEDSEAEATSGIAVVSEDGPRIADSFAAP